ncbi:PREDICTED: stigma-specific STIG1-like protein 4 [Camelina sativa]|uniref:Stigma-specific STIG1-like protein 4 n=1 Tax=Camelina sativa TaxID=90675 RepID=A0ABM0YGR6_CAMSA|nr:PREDICTED: stigma-specific STIG1-like protein 4 [Camelina sativa]
MMITVKQLLCAVFFVLLNSLLHQVRGQSYQLNTTSSWLKSHTKAATTTNCGRAKPPMCKPRTCKLSGPPMARMKCCRNQCVDVLSDPNHCRFCFRSCRFGLSCCGGDCVDTNDDPSNCGQCGNECESGAPCEFGMCGYAAPSSQPGTRKRHHRPKFHRPCPPSSPDSKLYDDRDDE